MSRCAAHGVRAAWFALVLGAVASPAEARPPSAPKALSKRQDPRPAQSRPSRIRRQTPPPAHSRPTSRPAKASDALKPIDYQLIKELELLRNLHFLRELEMLKLLAQ
ncbi:MAG: hypothetical protein H6707_06510 [Deltaproteobacteria bacterium]|nr:hypothetical protein [Deltaproteobacteria bacterium]